MNNKKNFTVFVVAIAIIGALVCWGQRIGYASVGEAVETYLDRTFSETAYGGKMFCTYETAGRKFVGDNLEEYGVVSCGEYYKEGNTYKEGSGFISPISLVLLEKNERYRVQSHAVPRDGSLMWPDMEKMFMPEVLKGVNEILYQGVSFTPEQKAKNYFESIGETFTVEPR